MPFRYKKTLLCGAALFCLASPAAAADENESLGVDTVIVEGRSLQTDMTPVEVLSGADLIHRRQGTLGETLSGLPGVHMDNFGGGAARPVIRGQTLPRIEILSDGATVYDVSSVSPDHAIITDPLLLDAIEVQRGPAAAIYGGNAINGAVNLIDSKVPKALPENGLDGAGETRYSIADDGLATAGRVTMSVGPFAFHAEGSTSDANDYNVPDGFGADKLADSFAQSTSYSVGASWITSKGYIGAAYTVQEANYGLPGHSHKNAVCHTHGRDLHCETHGGFSGPFPGADDDHTARIELRSERADLRADFERLLPGLEHARVRLSYTDYAHDEVDGVTLFSQYANEVYDSRVELTHAPLFGFTGVIGAQYTNGTFSGLNYNEAYEEQGLGFVEPYDYKSESVGVFWSERRTFGAVDFEIAARKDWRTISIPAPHYYIPPGYEATIALFEQFLKLPPGGWVTRQTESFHRLNPGAKHDPFSASIGATWNVGGGYSAALSFSHAERAPNVRELYAYGNNLATNSYEVGLAQSSRASSYFPKSTTDVTETTKSVNLTFRKAGGPLEFEIGVFHQGVDDYIFARLIEREEESGRPHNYLLYSAADAAFTGLDGEVSYGVSPESRVTVFGDYVRAKMKSEDDNLPRIPPGRLGARYAWEAGPLAADLEYYHTFGQDRVASYETETDGYDMLNATLSYALELPSSRTLEVYARGTNLANELAYVHTSFVKDQSPLRGRNLVFGVRATF